MVLVCRGGGTPPPLHTKSIAPTTPHPAGIAIPATFPQGKASLRWVGTLTISNRTPPQSRRCRDSSPYTPGAFASSGTCPHGEGVSLGISARKIPGAGICLPRGWGSAIFYVFPAFTGYVPHPAGRSGRRYRPPGRYGGSWGRNPSALPGYPPPSHDSSGRHP